MDGVDAALPIVLLHGAAVSGRYMLPTAERLAADRQVWVPDLPGFGSSDHPRDPLHVPELATALGAMLDASGLSRVHLLGNSLGAQVVADFAARWPARSASVTLVGPTVDRSGRTRMRQLWRLARDAFRERPPLIPLHLVDLARAGPRFALASLDIAIEDRIEDKLPRIAAPILIACGTRDPLAPPAWCEWLATRNPGTRLVVIDGPHALNYSRPTRLTELVRDFVAGVEADRRAGTT